MAGRRGHLWGSHCQAPLAYRRGGKRRLHPPNLPAPAHAHPAATPAARQQWPPCRPWLPLELLLATCRYPARQLAGLAGRCWQHGGHSGCCCALELALAAAAAGALPRPGIPDAWHKTSGLHIQVGQGNWPVGRSPSSAVAVADRQGRWEGRWQAGRLTGRLALTPTFLVHSLLAQGSQQGRRPLHRPEG